MDGLSGLSPKLQISELPGMMFVWDEVLMPGPGVT